MITDKLKEIIANQTEAALNILSYGCNVEGLNCEIFSEKFMQFGTETIIDAKNLSEMVRTVSESTDYLNNSIDILRLNKTIVCKPLTGNKGLEMCAEVARINEFLSDDFKKILEEASKENQYSLVEYCKTRISRLAEVNHGIHILTK